ncbi:MAG: UPF0182 family protein [Deltaproteobacteria bacterium]|nr:UPF0182 family protein [Deltaproteobacteria bacterium]
MLWIGISIYPDWLWFENLGFSPVFWTILLSKFGFGLMVWLLLALIIGMNIYAANRLNPSIGKGGNFKVAEPFILLQKAPLNGICSCAICISSLLAAPTLFLTGTSVFTCSRCLFTSSSKTGC